MDLWIRSQDRERLMKVNGFDYVDFNDEYVINGFGTNECDNYDLGIYNSKERTLEVLDEIQNLIKEYYDSIDYRIIPIYEMPKE